MQVGPWVGMGLIAVTSLLQNKGETSYQHGWSPLGLMYMAIFLVFLPLTFLLETVVYNSSDAIEALGESPLGWGEFRHFLGLRCIMCTASGFSRDDFWGNDITFDQRQTTAHIGLIHT